MANRPSRLAVRGGADGSTKVVRGSAPTVPCMRRATELKNVSAISASARSRVALANAAFSMIHVFAVFGAASARDSVSMAHWARWRYNAKRSAASA